MLGLEFTMPPYQGAYIESNETSPRLYVHYQLRKRWAVAGKADAANSAGSTRP